MTSVPNAAFTFHLLGNAHLDPVWLWDWRDGLNEGMITCRTILNLMDEDPELTFNRGESLIYQHLETQDPDTFARIRKQVQAGRWDVVGGTYLQADQNIPDTETLVRQFAQGQDYFRSRFGKPVEVAWSADCFGHAAGMPEIMAGAGIRYFAFTRPMKEMLPLARPAFWWVGPGGSRILGYRPMAGWYGAERHEMTERLDQLLAEAATSGLATVGVFYGLGNHGGGPTRRQLADIRAWAQQHPEVRIVHSTMHRFFHDLDAEVRTRPADYLPTHHGEMNFCQRGCYSSVARLKFLFRKAQSRLFRAETTSSVIAARAGLPAPDLAAAWDSLLFNTFHDILPGSSIERACDDQVEHLGVAVHGAQTAEFAALNRLAGAVDTTVLPAPAPDMPAGVAGLVWNPHPFACHGFVEFEACLDWRPIPQYKHRAAELPVRLLDARKQPLPFQVVATEHNFAPHLPWRKRLLVPMTLPPMGWSMLEMAWVEGAPPPTGPAAGVPPARAVSDHAIGNGVYEIEAPMGGRGIAIRRHGKPFLAGDGLAAAVFNDPWGSWGGPDHETVETAMLREPWTIRDVRVLENGPWRAALWVRLAGARSRLDLTLRVCAGRDTVEVDARVLWVEDTSRLKLIMPAAGGPAAEYEVLGASAVRRSVDGDVPGNRWVRLRGGPGQPLGFLSDSLSSFDYRDGTLYATIVRSSRYSYEPRIRDNEPWVPAAAAGELKFRFLLTSGEADLPRLAQEFDQPPVALPVPAKPGLLPPQGSLMELTPASLRLLAFKPAQDGGGWILRVQETAGTDTRPELTLLGKKSTLNQVHANQIASWRIRLGTGGQEPVCAPCDIQERPLAT